MPTTKTKEYVLPEPIVEHLERLELHAELSAEPELMKRQIRDLAYALRYHRALELEVHTNYLRNGSNISTARQSMRRHKDEGTFWTLYSGGKRRHYVLEIDFPMS